MRAASPRFIHDVLVVGGGPGGSTCARFAARSGLDVLVIERSGKRMGKQSCAGIFDHTWRTLELSPDEYPYPMTMAKSSDFKVFIREKEVSTRLDFVVNKLKRNFFFPNRHEFDAWLLSLAAESGALVIKDHAVTMHDIEFRDGVYSVQIGNELHEAKNIVGAAGPSCPVYRSFVTDGRPWSGTILHIMELKVPLREFFGPPFQSYFKFTQDRVFACSFVVGEEFVHISTSVISDEPKIKKRDVPLDKFLDLYREKGYLAEDFDASDHHSVGGSIRMFAEEPMNAMNETCFVVGDSAGSMQVDALNGISNAIRGGRMTAEGIVRGQDMQVRARLRKYLAQDLIGDWFQGVFERTT